MRKVIFFLSLLCGLQLYAQQSLDLSGQWQFRSERGYTAWVDVDQWQRRPSDCRYEVDGVALRLVVLLQSLYGALP